ncbi:MAG: hypothetical protein JKY37_00855, partial [Nannocystaceae bacterium]|nr:hypothetical protein [Nannocystaceae bacterium]
MDPNPPIAPFDDEAEFWEATVELVLAVVRRHDAGLADAEDQKRVAWVAHLRDEERRLRTSIDRRLDATRASGRKPAIDMLRDRFDLDGVELAVLKILVVCALEKERMGTIGSIFGPSVNELLLLLGLGVADRVRRLRTFTDGGRLVRGGLIRVEAG